MLCQFEQGKHDRDSECSAAIQDYKGVTVKDEGTLEHGKQTAFEDEIKS